MYLDGLWGPGPLGSLKGCQKKTEKGKEGKERGRDKQEGNRKKKENLGDKKKKKKMQGLWKRKLQGPQIEGDEETIFNFDSGCQINYSLGPAGV